MVAFTASFNPHLPKYLVFVVSNKPPPVFSLVRYNYFLSSWISYFPITSGCTSVSFLSCNHLLCLGPWLDVVPEDAAAFCPRKDIARSPGPLLTQLGFAVERWLSSCWRVHLKPYIVTLPAMPCTRWNFFPAAHDYRIGKTCLMGPWDLFVCGFMCNSLCLCMYLSIV